MTWNLWGYLHSISRDIDDFVEIDVGGVAYGLGSLVARKPLMARERISKYCWPTCQYDSSSMAQSSSAYVGIQFFLFLAGGLLLLGSGGKVLLLLSGFCSLLDLLLLSFALLGSSLDCGALTC